MQNAKILGDYNLIKQIGQGPLGSVFMAEHRFMKQQFAIKVLPDELSSDRSFIRRFEEEVVKLSKLDHPHLAKIYNISYANGVYFLVMDCIVNSQGETTNLAQYMMAQANRFSEPELLRLLQQLAGALDYMHQFKFNESRVIHGSIKLNNILVNQGNKGLHLYFTDVGLTPIIGAGAILTHTFKVVAKALEIDQDLFLDHANQMSYSNPALSSEKLLPLHSSFLQTFAFLAPEQKIFNAKASKNYKVDIYAFGVLVYYLITGKFPEGYFDLPSVCVPTLKWNWDGLIQCCLKADPETRIDSLLPLLQSISHTVPAVAERSHAKILVQNPCKSEVIQDEESNLAAIPHPVAEAILKQQCQASEQKVLEPKLVAAHLTQGDTAQVHMASKGHLCEEPSISKKERDVLKPVIHHAKLERPVNDLDPGAIFNIESTVTQYVPEQKEIRDIQPILTDMIVIKGGSFLRGSSSGNRDSIPAHYVTIDSFALDLHAVTNEQFVRFLEALGGEKDSNHHDVIRLKDSRIKRSAGKISIESGYAKHPVVGVTWYGASAYAQWVGKRLPTEAEWEIACKGGSENARYPTGDDIDKSQANFFSSDTTPVMSYAPNSYGLYDMAGNVYEWCLDWYGYNYYETSVQEPDNPQGPLQGVYRVLRGGCWKSLKDDLLCSRRHRNNPGTVNGTYGFRCAADVQ